MQRIAIIAAVALALMIGGAVIFGGPVVKWWKQRAAAAEATAEHATDDATGRSLEVVGTKELTTAAGDLSSAVGELRGAANALETRTRADPETRRAIPAGELARIRAHDASLCADAVVRCDGGPAAAPRPAAPGEGALPALDVAGE